MLSGHTWAEIKFYISRIIWITWVWARGGFEKIVKNPLNLCKKEEEEEEEWHE